MKRVVRSTSTCLMASFVLASVGWVSSVSAQTLTNYWTYETSETGATRFNKLDEAEAELRAVGVSESYLQYAGEDNNDASEIKMQYLPEPQQVWPDDSPAWTYKACDWGRTHHDCGADGAPGPFLSEEAALNWLLHSGWITCGIVPGSVVPLAGWTQGQGFVAPTSTPAAPYQEAQLRPYAFTAKRNPPPPQTPDCSDTQSGTAIVYRTRTLQCPTGAANGQPPLDQSPYNKVGPDANGQFKCVNNATAEITKSSNVYDHSVKHCKGNPCNPMTGAKIETTVDYVAPGIEFSRTFRSKMAPWVNYDASIRRMPTQWTHSYVRVVRMRGDGTAPNELLRPDGTSIPVSALAGHADVYVAHDGSGTQVRPGAGIGEWDVLFSDGSREHYDSVTCTVAEEDYTRPRLAYIEDASVSRTSVYYSDDCVDHPNQITGPFGHSVSITIAPFDPDAPTYVEKITDAAGRDIVYGYSAGNTGNLVSVTYQNGESLQYHYEDVQPGNEQLLTGVTDEEGQRFSTFAYDFIGRAISTEHAGGDYKYTFDYDSGYPSSNITIATDALGNQETYRFYTGGPARPWSIARSIGNDKEKYENSGQYRITQRQDALSIKTGYYYNDFHRTKRVEDDGKSTSRTTEYEYLNDTSDLRTKTIRPSVCNDGTTRYAEDEIVYLPGTQIVSQVISRGYRANGAACDAIDRTIMFSNHNAAGQPQQIDGPRTDVADTITVGYYECSTGSHCGQIQSVTNALGHVTTFDGYDTNGRLLQSTDPNGLVTNFAYDFRGRLISSSQTPTVGSQRLTTFTYEAADLLKTATLPNGLVLSYDYNAAHRLLSVSDNLGNHIDYGYDLHGNRTDADVFDSSNVLKQATDFTFDTVHRLDTINRGGSITDLVYDFAGRLIQEIDPKGGLTRYSNDRFNRVFQINAADAGRTNFWYDVADNVISIRTPISDTTTYVYDDLGNRLSESSPDRGALSYAYDEAGNLLSQTDARGKLTSHSYDVLNRLILTTLDGGQTIAYNYDLNAHGKGRLSNTVDSSGSTSWSYDQFGAVTQKQQTIGSVMLTTAYSYDAAGQVLTMTLPSGKVVTFGYSGHLQNSVSIDGQLLLSGAAYEPFGSVSGWTWGDATVSTRSYNLRGLVSSHTLAGDTRTLGYDLIGNIETLDDARHDLDMGYDAVSRIKNVTATPIPGGAVLPGSQVFTYDRNGNRKSQKEDGTTTNYAIASASNRLLSHTGPTPKTYSYDAAGNIVGDGFHGYGYDDRGRLVDVDLGTTASYQHNALGQRVLKNTGSTTLFAYGESGELLGEYDAIGTPIQETVFFNGMPVAVLQGSSIYQVHSDHLGTPRAIVDMGTVIWRWESDAFGTMLPDEDPDGNGTGFTYNLRFPGQYYDVETGLYYNYFRTYDPSTGRYLESDPIGLQGGLNSYSYVLQNPARWGDPLGLETCILITRNSAGFGTHAALWTDGSETRDGSFLYDPAGSFVPSVEEGIGEITFDNAEIAAFEEFHRQNFGDSTEKVCKATSDDEEDKILTNIQNRSACPVLFCASCVSEVLNGVETFRGFGSLLPGNLTPPPDYPWEKPTIKVKR